MKGENRFVKVTAAFICVLSGAVFKRVRLR